MFIVCRKIITLYKSGELGQSPVDPSNWWVMSGYTAQGLYTKAMCREYLAEVKEKHPQHIFKGMFIKKDDSTAFECY